MATTTIVRELPVADIGDSLEQSERRCAALERRAIDAEALLAAFMTHAPIGMHLLDAEGLVDRVLSGAADLATARADLVALVAKVEVAFTGR